jgi:hypothetical protein
MKGGRRWTCMTSLNCVGKEGMCVVDVGMGRKYGYLESFVEISVRWNRVKVRVVSKYNRCGAQQSLGTAVVAMRTSR